jgi:hypothetical protein
MYGKCLHVWFPTQLSTRVVISAPFHPACLVGCGALRLHGISSVIAIFTKSNHDPTIFSTAVEYPYCYLKRKLLIMSSPSESHSLVFIVIPLLIVVYIGNLLHNVYYNLHRHPLAHIPGPKLAAATYLYQTYYSLVGGSRYYIEIAAMHKKYG